MEMKFYKCSVCGNFANLLEIGGGELVCCGKPMEEQKANSKDAAKEKHVPAYVLSGDVLDVQIGDVIHPMEPEHYIQWIMVVQGECVQYCKLSPGQEPKASFTIHVKTPFTVYEYCNLHGLWVKE